MMESSRRVVIYHFCGPVFGAPFREAARLLAARSGVKIVTVISTKGDPERPAAIERIREARQSLQERLAPRRCIELRVRDVNASPFLRRIRGAGAVGIVTGFNQIFGRDAIDAFDDLVNVHPSVLPYYRGPSPTYWCIERGEARTGFTVHRITEQIDAGEILYQEIVPVDGERDPAALATRIAHAAAGVFVRYLETAMRGDRWQATVIDASAAYTHPVAYMPAPPPKA